MSAPLALAQATDKDAIPPTPDALIEEWQQHWTFNADGSRVYHERRRVRLNNDRAYGDFADPRIMFESGSEKVEVLAARVRTPGGTVVDTPAYSRNEVSPSGAAGWPAFAALRQLVLTHSGIEPGCVAELEYRVTSDAACAREPAADLCLQSRYPILLRTIIVDVPVEADFSPVVMGLAEDQYSYQATGQTGPAGSGVVTHRWDFHNLAALVDEPHAAPWQKRTARLCFARTGDADAWIVERLAALPATDDERETLAATAKRWAAEEVGQSARVREVQKRLAARFNFVDFDAAHRPSRSRPAAEVFTTGYGLPDEAAAVLLGLLRGIGVAARPALLVSDDVWLDAAPQDRCVAAFAVLVDAPAGPEIWHAQHGQIERDARWAGHVLLCVDDDGNVQRTPLPRFTSPDDSRIDINAQIAIAADGSYRGRAAISATGMFISAARLADGDAQRDRVRAMLRAVLPNAAVDDVQVARLGPGLLICEATVTSEAPLKRAAEHFQFQLASDGPAAATAPLPLSHARRVLPVRLPGPYDERVALEVTWPDGWTVGAVPPERTASDGAWGSVSQTATREGAKLTITRHTRFATADFAPALFADVRTALNALRAEAARTILLKP